MFWIRCQCLNYGSFSLCCLEAIKVTSSEVEKLLDFHVSASLGGSLDNVHTLCKGFIVAYVCDEILKYDVGITLGGGYEESDVNSDDVDTFTTEYTTTWSYTTSDDPLRAGRNSDVIGKLTRATGLSDCVVTTNLTPLQ